MSFGDIGAILTTLARGSHCESNVSMRTVEPESVYAGKEWSSTFLPTIRERPDTSVSVRHPKWYVMRYAFSGEMLVCRVLRMVGMEYRQFKYEVQVPREPPVMHSYFPGYMMVRFDKQLDRWQQLLDMPHVVGLLGDPMDPSSISDELMAELIERLPRRPDKPTILKSFARGAQAKIKVGPFRMFTLDIGDVCFITKTVAGSVTIFGRATNQSFRMADVELV